MKILVCGGRDFTDYNYLEQVLIGLRKRAAWFGDIIEIIHGGARGADSLAGAFAMRYGIPFTVYEADWNHHGRSAGPIRNQRMLEEGKPDLVVAFPGGKGTDHMVRIAEEAGVRVEKY